MLLLGIILLGAALRFMLLGAPSLWYDEAVSLAIADRLSLGQILANQGHSSHPPFYYLLLRAWIRLAGISDLIVRVPSALAGVLTVPLVFQAGRRLFDRRVGTWSALLIAVFPFHITYAREARMYTLLALLTVLSLNVFLLALERRRWQAWVGYWLCLVLATYTHYFIAFVILVYHLYLLLIWQEHRSLWRPVIATDVLLLLAFLPQAAIFVQESKVAFSSSYWLGNPSLLAFFTTIYFFIAGYTVPEQLNLLGLFLTLSWLAVGLYELHSQRRSDSRTRKHLGLVVLGAFVPLLLVLLVSQIRPIFLERTLIVCTPFLVLLLARILAQNRWRSPVPYVAGFLGVLLGISLHGLYFDPAAQKPPLRQAAVRIEEAFTEGDMVLHTGVGSFLPFLFYNPPPEHYLLWGDPDPLKPATTYELFGGKIATTESLAGHRRLWLVVMLDRSIAYQYDQLSWFDENFMPLGDTDVDGISVRLYDMVRQSD